MSIVDDVKSILAEMEAETFVESEMYDDRKKEQLARENIRQLASRLITYPLKALYVGFKESVSERPPLVTKENLVDFLTQHFVNKVHTVKVDHVPTGVVLLIDEKDFYGKLETILANKGSLSIEENLRRNGIEFVKSDTLFFGGPIG